MQYLCVKVQHAQLVYKVRVARHMTYHHCMGACVVSICRNQSHELPKLRLE